MMTMERTDTHRPSAIKPEEYRFVAFGTIKIEGLGDVDAVLAQRQLLNEHMAITGGKWSSHEHGGNCAVCGSVNMIYDLIFHHEPTNSYIRVGADCAEKLDIGNADLFRRHEAFKKGLHAAMAFRKGKTKAAAILADNGLTAAWELYGTNSEDTDVWTIQNMIGKLVKYGDISDKQIAYIRILLDRIARRDEIAAERAAERQAAKAAPTGRVEFSGEIVKFEARESDYGPAYKITVKTDEGWLCWMTCPEALFREVEKVFGDLFRRQHTPQRGDRVTLTATVKPSETDDRFSFGKRPTLVSYEPGEAMRKALAESRAQEQPEGHSCLSDVCSRGDHAACPDVEANCCECSCHLID